MITAAALLGARAIGAGLLGQTKAWHWNQNAVIRYTSGFAREEMRS